MSVAVEVIRRHVCDVCGSGDGVEKVRITTLDGNGKVTKTSTIELCARLEDGTPGHLAPIKEAVAAKDSLRPGALRKSRRKR